MLVMRAGSSAHSWLIAAIPRTAASNRLVNWKPEYNSNGYTWNVWEWELS